jgi:hypothetical protein
LQIVADSPLRDRQAARQEDEREKPIFAPHHAIVKNNENTMVGQSRSHGYKSRTGDKSLKILTEK